MYRDTACTGFRTLQRRERTSHRCGVVITMWAEESSFKSAAVSPVNITTALSKPVPNLTFQSA